MTREERKEQAEMRDEYYAMEERVTALEDQRDELREALECLLVGACAVGVPHKGEREVLQDAVDIARAALQEAEG